MHILDDRKGRPYGERLSAAAGRKAPPYGVGRSALVVVGADDHIGPNPGSTQCGQVVRILRLAALYFRGMLAPGKH